jgi:hypothetical protein
MHPRHVGSLQPSDVSVVYICTLYSIHRHGRSLQPPDLFVGYICTVQHEYLHTKTISVNPQGWSQGIPLFQIVHDLKKELVRALVSH